MISSDLTIKARGLSSGPKDLIMVDPSTFVYEFPMMVFDVFDVFSGQINIMLIFFGEDILFFTT